MFRRSPSVVGQTHDQTISLVEEVGLREYEISGIKLSSLRPRAVFVINSQGVHCLPFSGGNLPKIALALLAVLCAPLQYRLLARRHRHER